MTRPIEEKSGFHFEFEPQNGGDSLGKGWGETLCRISARSLPGLPRFLCRRTGIKTLGTNFDNRISLPDSSPFWDSNTK
jgi:hypothetical protein